MNVILTPRKKLFVSVGVGFVAAVISWFYLEKQEQKIKTHYQMTTVVVAKKYIKEGKAVDLDLVEEIPVPQVYLQPTAVKKRGELKGPKGELFFTARIGILKGEQLTQSKLIEQKGLRNMALILAPGQTALSLNLNAEQAVGGHIAPGDTVHVYSTIQQQPNWPKDRTTLLLQHIRVLAVGDRVLDPAARQFQSTEEKSPKFDNVLVTLALSPQEAGLVTLAHEKGKITLALAYPFDPQDYSVSPMELIHLR